MSIFTSIKGQIIKNENEKETMPFGIEGVDAFEMKLNKNVLNWLTSNKVLKVKKIVPLKKGVCEIQYTDLDTNNRFFKGSNLRTRTIKDDWEEFKFYSHTQNTGFESLYSNEEKWERLDPEDSCLLQFTLNHFKYESYEEFCELNKDLTTEEELKEKLFELIEDFTKTKTVNEWEIGEEDDEIA